MDQYGNMEVHLARSLFSKSTQNVYLYIVQAIDRILFSMTLKIPNTYNLIYKTHIISLYRKLKYFYNKLRIIFVKMEICHIPG